MDRIAIATFKERVDLRRVVGHYLTLERKGATYLGLCPFHDDHHPSLRVDPAKGLYRCFSCGAGGDAFRFVQEKEGCGFMEAVRICADICRLTVPAADVKRPECRLESAPAAQVPVPTIEENELFGQTLTAYDPGMDELRATYAAFGVGVAPEVVPEAWKFTRGRIVFPIRNASGELVAFAARFRGDLSIKKTAKYLNSPTSPVYKKDTLLYGWHRALGKIRETGTVFLTEGYKDTLAMHAAGFTNTVALCGTNLSAHHIEQIRREAATVCLLLDADEAGRKTVAEVMPRLRKAGLQVVDMLPEGGKDPDEMFRSLGREAFAGWVGKGMLSPARREREALLVAACRRWPDTGCLDEDGKEVSYVDHLREVLATDDLLPVGGLAGALDATPQESLPETPTLDNLYALHTDPSHSGRVRRSELMRYLALSYMEIRLADRIRHTLRRLSGTFANEESRNGLLSELQYQRDCLRDVSWELGRR